MDIPFLSGLLASAKSNENENSPAALDLRTALDNAARAYQNMGPAVSGAYGNMLSNAAQNYAPAANYLSQVWGNGAPTTDMAHQGTINPQTGAFTSFAPPPQPVGAPPPGQVAPGTGVNGGTQPLIFPGANPTKV
jgi:hypothetical protein